MPFTFNPSPKAVEKIKIYKGPYGNNDGPWKTKIESIVKKRLKSKNSAIAEEQFLKFQYIQGSANDEFALTHSQNGLIDAILQSYNNHHKLVLRPDDFWITILTQFSFYVNAHPEDLRSKFVNFEGKKELEVYADGTLHTAPYDELVDLMSREIQKNLTDPEIRDWVQPGFTTTTKTDQMVSSVILMATMQKYFDYKFCLCCGLPEVTLLGTVEDWQKLQQKVQKLAQYDLKNQEMTEWLKLLNPVLDEMIKSVSGQPDLEFWNLVCHHTSTGSGPTYLSGWITAFLVFDTDGKWISHQTKLKTWSGGEIDGHGYPIIDCDDVPVGFCEVPVLVDDNGTPYKTKMFAGSFGAEVKGDNDTLQPRSDWCLVIDPTA